MTYDKLSLRFGEFTLKAKPQPIREIGLESYSKRAQTVSGSENR